jgi:polyhydroxybutyrate depolymerase
MRASSLILPPSPPKIESMPQSFRIVCLGLALWAAAFTPAQAHTLSVGGLARTYELYRPEGLSRARPVPLVIVLHGGFGTGRQAERSYRWDAKAGRGGFVVAYPDGIWRSWNAGGICCGRAHRDLVDDVGFLTQLIETVSRAENIDPKRVYLTGISNGAAMAYRYTCEGSYPIAAVGSVAGSFAVACPHPHAVSVMEIHGLSDRNIPFAGGHGEKSVTQVQWLPIERTLNEFRDADHCAAPTSRKSGPVRTESSRCAEKREVVLIAIAGAGHQWPGGRPPRRFIARLLRLDPPSTALDATSVLWDFFRAHPAK